MTPLKVKQKLFEARDVIHDLHLNTDRYEIHVALNKFYTEWTELLDKFLETYYGKYNGIKGSMTIDCNTDLDLNMYLKGLMLFLNTDIETIIDKDLDSDLQNVIADMKSLVNHTFYFLSLK